MCTPFLVLLLLTQDGASLPGSSMFNPLETVTTSADVARGKQLLEKEQNRAAELKEKAFVEHFNALVQALSEVSKAYRSKHAIDLKTVESVKKAYRGLERADPLFRVER